MSEIWHRFITIFPNIAIEQPYYISKYSTMGVGGSFMFAVYPTTQNELINVVDFFMGENADFVILGRCSNVLCSSSHKNIVVIKTDLMNSIRLSNDVLFLDSGVKLATLEAFCLKNNIGGFEFLSGIPASLGGAVYMNAGVFNNSISNNLLSVKAYSLSQKKVFELSKEECFFSYRHSRFMHSNEVILSACLQAKVTKKEEILDKIVYYKDKRNNQPKGKSLGSIFKNPSGVSAGKLIESASLKDVQIGGAVVSQKHANFILNNGTATAEDVAKLIKKIKTTVFDTHNIILEEEIRYLGDFNAINK